MPPRRGAFLRFREALLRQLDGSEAALRNAGSLLTTAAAVLGESEATASFIASIAVEELGKALLLRKRTRAQLNNASIRLYSRLFADRPEWVDREKELHAVAPWDEFVRRARDGGLRDHEGKLDELRAYYRQALPQVIRATDSEIVVASIDIFAGQSPAHVRKTIENALYLRWDDSSGEWRQPAQCIAEVRGFLDGMSEVHQRLTSDLPSERAHVARQLEILRGHAEANGLRESLIFRLSGPVQHAHPADSAPEK